MFFFPLTKKSRARYATARTLYAQAIAQSRQPVFYSDLSVPDTFNGRFELTALNVGLMVTDLTRRDAESKKLAQALFDEMFLDLEQVCRQIGVGDLSVPRHVKRMMTALKGRALTYADAIKSGTLQDALARNLYGTVERPSESVLNAMSAYVAELHTSLAAQSLNSGNVSFPPVNTNGVTQNGTSSKAA